MERKLVTRAQLQSVILRRLANPGADRRLGRGVHYFPEEVAKQFGPVVHQHPSGPAEGTNVTTSEIAEGLWSLLGQGLVYIDMQQQAPENWRWTLTSAGAAAAQDQAANPDDPEGYLARLRQRVPAASAVVVQYAQEAVWAYNARCYLASATMLGVASEAAFLETAGAMVGWLAIGRERENFQALVEQRRTAYIAKFEAFRKLVEKHKPSLPDDLRDGMTLTMDAVLDLLRANRNDAGHPTGKRISRDDQFVHLQVFVRYLEKLYMLKEFFEAARTRPADELSGR